MVTTAPAPLAPSERSGAPPARLIARRRALPGSRAVLGALLVTAAAVGTFLAYTGATAGPSDAVVVAARSLRIGEVLDADDLRLVRVDLPEGTRDGAFDAIEALDGHVVLGPVAQGELVQRAAVTDDAVVPAAHEVALTLPRTHLAAGRLQPGDLVDVFVTDDVGTRSVVRAARVVEIDRPDGSLTSGREQILVVAVTSDDDVAAVVHALRTGEVTVVRSTGTDPGAEPITHAGASAEDGDDAGGDEG